MSEIQFKRRGSLGCVAFASSDFPDTIFIPVEAIANVSFVFELRFGLSSEQAREAAKTYLEESYAQHLAHESIHLVLRRIANEDELPIGATMRGWHNPISQEFERDINISAIDKALIGKDMHFEKFG